MKFVVGTVGEKTLVILYKMCIRDRCKGAVSVLVDGYYDKKVGVLDSPKLDRKSVV